MAKVSRARLKAWFMRGLYPTQQQFHHWLDSFFHKDDRLPISSVEGLTDTLNGKADSSLLTGKQDKTDSRLDTEDKTVVGAINELKDTADALKDAEGIAYAAPSRPAVNTVAEALDDLYTMAAAAEKYLPIPETEITRMFNQNR